MEFTSESHEQYREAYAMATRYQQKNQKQGLPVRPVALESLLNERMISCRIDLGVLEIPTSMIVGVAEETEGAGLYTKEFLPISKPNSDYAKAWCFIYAACDGRTEIQDAIRCMEYLGKFYICDGLKRVSVAKYLGHPVMRSQVIRIMPVKTDSREVELYYDFLLHYQLTQMYQLQFTQRGYFEKLQKAMGKLPHGKWHDSERSDFLSVWPTIENAFRESYADNLPITPADALVVLLDKYPFVPIIRMDGWILARLFQTVWKELFFLGDPCSATGSTNAVKAKRHTA